MHLQRPNCTFGSETQTTLTTNTKTNTNFRCETLETLGTQTTQMLKFKTPTANLNILQLKNVAPTTTTTTIQQKRNATRSNGPQSQTQTLHEQNQRYQSVASAKSIQRTASMNVVGCNKQQMNGQLAITNCNTSGTMASSSCSSSPPSAASKQQLAARVKSITGKSRFLMAFGLLSPQANQFGVRRDWPLYWPVGSCPGHSRD